MAELSVQNVTLGYEGRPVVEGLSFTVGSGDYLYILGENGSGKSTLIKAILGLHPAMEGEIRWEGLKPSEIGYLPQQTDVQRDFPASVIEIVRSGLISRGGLRPFYTKEEKGARRREYGAAGDYPPRPALLPGAVRRTAAAGAAGEGPLRGPEDAALRRAGRRAGPRGVGGDV